MILSQITKFQIKSKSNHTSFKSNHYVWFNHDLNQIMIWICPSLVCVRLTKSVRVSVKRSLLGGRRWWSTSRQPDSWTRQRLGDQGI